MKINLLKLKKKKINQKKNIISDNFLINNNEIDLSHGNNNENNVEENTCGEINENNKNNKDKYEELMTNEDYALYISEAINDNNIKKKNINLSDTKKKTKKSKNIFVTNNDEIINIKKNDDNIINNNSVDDNSSIFNKTEKISKKDIDEINNNLKATSTLEQIQSYALKFGINIFSGSTKTGKPKNKTKGDLIIEIKDSIKNYN